MSTTLPIPRLAIVVGLACALLVALMSGSAVATSVDDKRLAAAEARQAYLASYGTPEPVDSRTASALAQQSYLASYGETTPISPASSDDGTPWLPIAGIAIAGLGLVGVLRPGVRRIRTRRAAARLAA
jgi:hypothetical protein